MIRQKKQKVKQLFGDDKETIILIHPSLACSYQNIIDVLDEMLITDIKKYVLLDDKNTAKALAAVSKQPC